MTERMNKLSNFINIPSPDPEDARRRRLLNIMLLGVVIAALLALVAPLISAPMALAGEQEGVRALGFGVALALFGAAGIYALNRYVSGELAGALFLLLLIALPAFSDEPREVINGRGLLVFTIPILAASVLLRPWASFVAAGLSGLTIIAVGLEVPGYFPNVPAIVAFFILALVSWLSARSLERALEDSRASSEALRESEEQYRQLIETMQEGIWTIDQDAYTTFVNPRMAEMLGYTVDEMQGKHLFSFMDKDGMEIAKRNLERGLQGIKEQRDFEFVRKDGSRICALLATSPLTDADGNYIGAMAGVWDITERKRAEEALRREKDFVESLVRTAQAIVLVLDTKGRIVRFNPYMEEISGYRLEEVKGKDWFTTFLPKRDHDRIRELFSKAVSDIQTRGNVNSIVTKDGREREIEWYDKTLKDARGKVVGILAIGQDITERKRAEEEVRRYLEQVEALREIDRVITSTLDLPGVLNIILEELERVIPYHSAAVFLLSDGTATVAAARGHPDVARALEVSFPVQEDALVAELMQEMHPLVLTDAQADERFLARGGTEYVRSWMGVPLMAKGRAVGFLGIDHREPGVYDEERVEMAQAFASQVAIAIENARLYEEAQRELAERKRGEEEIRRLSQFRESIIDTANVWLDVLDEKANVVVWNKAAEEISGYSREEVVGHDKIWEWLYPDEEYRHEITAEAATIIEKGEVVEDFETTIRRKDGQTRIISWNSRNLLNEKGNPIGSIALGRDITERKRAEEALRESEERFRDLVEHSFDLICTHDLQGQLLWVNPAAEKVSGYTAEQLVGTNLRDLLAPDVRGLFDDYLAKIEREGEASGFMRMVTPSGEQRIWEYHNSLRVEGVRAPIVRGRARDITKRKRAEEERERLLAELEAKNRELHSFVYTVSHDLKAPLVSLGGFSSMLQKECYDRLGEQGQHYLDRLQANVFHMDDLIMHLLELSRIGRVVGPTVEIDVAALVREVQEDLAVKLEDSGAELVVQEPLPTIRADRTRIRQVFTNLIDNAVKFRSEERPLRIEVGCQEEGGFHRFHVSDNGIGIAPQHQEWIFEPFQQLEAETEGVGMGLALVKGIVEHHGGRVWVESELEQGAAFCFTLPRSR